MGMFDWIRTPCTEKECKGYLETQSKAGDCLLRDYSLENAPQYIIDDIIGDYMTCNKCGKSKKVSATPPVQPRVYLE